MCNPELSSSWATRVHVMKCDHAVQLCTCCICACTVHIFRHLGSGLEHQLNCDFCLSTVTCELWTTFLFEIFNSVFLNIIRLLLVSVHFFTMLPPLSVAFFSVVTFPLMVFYGLSFSCCPTALHQMFRSDFAGLSLEHCSFDHFRASCSSFLTDICLVLFCMSFLLQLLCMRHFTSDNFHCFCILPKFSSILPSPFSVAKMFVWSQDASRQRDARVIRCEDWRAAETTHQVCTVLFHLNFQP